MDALAALRRWAYEVTLPGVLDDHGQPWLFRIEPLPAADWMIASIDPTHMAYLPGLLQGEHRERMMQAIEDGLVTMAQLEEVNHDAIEVVSGWRWWEAGKLIACAAGQWQTLGGLLTLAGVDPQQVPLGAFLGAVYARLWENASKSDRAKLAQQVATPPASMINPDDPDKWDDEAAEAAIRAFLTAGPTGTRE